MKTCLNYPVRMKKINIYLYCIAALLTIGIASAYAEPKQVPPGRISHSVVYDSANKQLIVFGGYGNSGFFADTWAYDIGKNAWRNLDKKGNVPPARSGHSAVYDSSSKKMIVFGGQYIANFADTYYLDTWVYDIEKNTWEEIETEEGPAARYAHSAIYDPINKQMIIFGGRNEKGNLSDLWAYDVERKTWKRIDAENTPTERAYHSAVYDSANKQMIVFAGHDNSGDLSDTWAYDIEKKQWKDKDDTPPARNYPTAIYDPIGKQMIIRGGHGQGDTVYDMWAFDIEKNKWKEIVASEKTSPSKNCHNGRAIYDPINKQIIFFGGSIRETFLSDIFTYNIDKKKWEKIQPTK